MHYDDIPLSINMGTYLVMTKVRRETTKLRDQILIDYTNKGK